MENRSQPWKPFEIVLADYLLQGRESMKGSEANKHLKTQAKFIDKCFYIDTTIKNMIIICNLRG